MGFNPKPPPNADELFDPLEEEEADVGSVKMVSFSYEKTGDDGSISKFHISVPLLTIVPIPFIRIDEMNINFTAKLSEAHTSSDTSTDTAKDSESSKSYSSTSSRSSSWWWRSSRRSYSQNSSYSSSHNSSSSESSSTSRYNTEYKMNIQVRAVQDDMPAGLSKILELLNSSIKDEPIEEDTQK